MCLCSVSPTVDARGLGRMRINIGRTSKILTVHTIYLSKRKVSMILARTPVDATLCTAAQKDTLRSVTLSDDSEMSPMVRSAHRGTWSSGV